MVIDDSYEPQPGIDYNDGRRGSMVFVPHTVRSTTDPLRDDGHPVDPELTGQGHQQYDGYDFEHPTPPAFTRTFSAPLPQRVGFLRHPLTPIKDPVGSYNDHPRSRHSSISSVLGAPEAEPSTARPPPLRPPRKGSSHRSKRYRWSWQTVYNRQFRHSYISRPLISSIMQKSSTRAVPSKCRRHRYPRS
jgi:hypothetical protein